MSPGVISGTTTVCENSSEIIVLSNVTSGTINGLTASNGDYQWQYSDDNNNWSDIIINGNNATFNGYTFKSIPILSFKLISWWLELPIKKGQNIDLTLGI